MTEFSETIVRYPDGQTNVDKPPDSVLALGFVPEQAGIRGQALPASWLNWGFQTMFREINRDKVSNAAGVGLFPYVNCGIRLEAIDMADQNKYLIAIGFKDESGVHTLHVVSNQGLTLGTPTSGGDQPILGGVNVRSVGYSRQLGDLALTEPPPPAPLPAIALINVDATGVTGTAGSATVTNDSVGPVVWALGASEGMTATPSSGTLGINGSQQIALAYTTAGTKTLTLVNGVGGGVSGSPFTIEVTPYEPPVQQPDIALSAVSAAGVTGTAGSATVTNGIGLGAANWSLTSSAGMTATPSSGTLSPGAAQVVQLDYTTAGSKTLTLINDSAGGVTGSPATITVSLAPPNITLSAVSATGQVGINGSATVSNEAGHGSANWTLTPSSGMTATPSSGTLAAGASQSVVLAYTTAATHTLTLANGSGGLVFGSPDTINVTLQPPNIALSNVSTSGQQVGTNGSATVTNGTGLGSANWTLTPSSGMTATPSSGTLAAGASQSVVLAYTTSGSKTLTLANGSGGNVTGSPASISVAVQPGTTLLFDVPWADGLVTGSGPNHWAWSQRVATDRMKVLGTTGDKYCRFTMSPGDNPHAPQYPQTERVELFGVRNAAGAYLDNYVMGETRRIKFWTRCVSPWTNPVNVPGVGVWGIFLQFKGPQPFTSPAFSMNATDRYFMLTKMGDQRTASNTERVFSYNALNVGSKVFWEINIKFAVGDTGFINVKRTDATVNGGAQQTVFSISNIPTLQFDPSVAPGLTPNAHHLKHGYYRSEQDFTAIIDCGPFTIEKV